MVLSFLKWGLISLTIIYLIHHLYMFFLNILTIPQIKDLVNKPTEQYDELFKTITTNTKDNSNTGSVDNMTEELSSFLKDLKKHHLIQIATITLVIITIVTIILITIRH